MPGNYRRVLRTTRILTDARMAADMLANRLRDGGPAMTRSEIRERVTYIASKLNELVPRSALRKEED